MSEKKNLKIIFLDIDGVMNSVESCTNHNRPHRYFDLPCQPMIDNLNYIIDQTGARIVVSSTWRKLFGRHGMDYLLYLVGVRPEVVDGITPQVLSGYRGQEIRLWLEKHGEVTHFVILDDDSDMVPFMDRFVHTDRQVGLTRANAEQAIKILNTDWEGLPNAETSKEPFV